MRLSVGHGRERWDACGKAARQTPQRRLGRARVRRRADPGALQPRASSSSAGDDSGHLGAAPPPGLARRASSASERAAGARGRRLHWLRLPYPAQGSDSQLVHVRVLLMHW